MRISIDLSAIPLNLTGVGRYAIDMLAAQKLDGIVDDIDLVGVARKGDIARMKDFLPAMEIIGLVPNSRVARLAFEAMALGRSLNRIGVSLHHGVHYTIPGGFSGKIVTTIHDSTLIEHPEWHERSKVVFFTRAMTRAAKRSDALIFPSMAAKDGFLRHFDPGGLLEVIPHGVNSARFSPSATHDDDEILHRLGIDQDFLFFCGTLEPRKNLRRLLEAFSLVKETNVSLVIAGLQGWGDSAFGSAAITAMIRTGQVKVLGYVSDAQLGVLYRKCIATLYPSLEEGFGLPALEAISQGALLITSQRSAMAEIVGSKALFVDPLSVTSIATSISRALAGGNELDLMRRDGVDTAAHYSWEASAIRHLKLYRRILGT